MASQGQDTPVRSIEPGAALAAPADTAQCNALYGQTQQTAKSLEAWTHPSTVHLSQHCYTPCIRQRHTGAKMALTICCWSIRPSHKG